jgi:hypothetical protein
MCCLKSLISNPNLLYRHLSRDIMLKIESSNSVMIAWPWVYNIQFFHKLKDYNLSFHLCENPRISYNVLVPYPGIKSARANQVLNPGYSISH